jgi:uncharacterized Zn-binding protein involved in type VI secretion
MPVTVAIHPPKTPVTKGSQGIAKATLPNVCKMPGPPAPFVPSPLPNIAKSELSPKGYSRSVKIDGNAVAIRGATFNSIGDMASKGTGGGLISANTHGPAKFISPGSLTVKIEGKNVHLLTDMMLNNCGPSGSPPNTGATLMGVHQIDRTASPEERELYRIMCDCHYNTPVEDENDCVGNGNRKHECCEQAIAKHTPPPDLGGERGYQFDAAGNPSLVPPGSTRASMAAAGTIKGTMWPDACAMSGGNPTQFFDFKFLCRGGTSYYDRHSGKVVNIPARGNADAMFYSGKGRGKSQYQKYKELGDKLNPPCSKDPKVITSRACRK